MVRGRQGSHPSGRMVSVRLDPETEQRLNELAERTGRSRGSYLRLALQAMLPVLEREHWQHQLSRYESNRLDEEFIRLTAELMEAPSQDPELGSGSGH